LLGKLKEPGTLDNMTWTWLEDTCRSQIVAWNTSLWSVIGSSGLTVWLCNSATRVSSLNLPIIVGWSLLCLRNHKRPVDILCTIDSE
jgi:hypothetical protein